MGYLLTAIASSAAMAVVLKLFRGGTGNRYGILLGNYITCAVLSLLYLPAGAQAGPDTASVICGIIGGFLFVAGLVGMQSSIRTNGAILTSAFSKMGLVVPLLISLLFLKEPLEVLQIPGILLVLAAIWLICIDKNSDVSHQPFLLILVLLACGGGDAMAKIFAYTGSSDMDGWYFLILFLTAILLTGVLAFTEFRRTRKNILLRDLLAGILVGIPNYYSSYLLLQALKGLPAFVVYPVFSIGTLAVITIISMFLFHEHPGRRKWIGLTVAAAALILLAV